MADDEQLQSWSDSLSEAWERHRTRLFENQRRVSEWLVEQVEPKPGETMLELACGPGETGFLVAERVGPSGKLIATDLGPGMVAAAERGAADKGLTNVECRTMDAQANDLPDASVDGVVCRFGIMLMPEPERALAEAHRVLRPGGRLAYAVWGPPDRNPWLSLLAMAVVQNGHQPPGGNPFEAGGVFSLADPDRNRELVTAAGFGQPRVEELAGAFRAADADDYWDFQTQVSGALAVLIGSLSADEVRAIRQTWEPLIEPFRDGDGYALPSLAIGVAATV